VGKGRDKRKRKQKKIARKEKLREALPPKTKPVKPPQPVVPPPDGT